MDYTQDFASVLHWLADHTDCLVAIEFGAANPHEEDESDRPYMVIGRHQTVLEGVDASDRTAPGSAVARVSTGVDSWVLLDAASATHCVVREDAAKVWFHDTGYVMFFRADAEVNSRL